MKTRILIYSLAGFTALHHSSESIAQKPSKIYSAASALNQEDAGSVHVAIIGARHLDEVLTELQPSFEINERIALERLFR